MRIELLTFAAIVAIWYLASIFLPQAVDTCLDGVCSFTVGSVLLSLAIPLFLVLIPVVLERVMYGKSLVRALRDIGITRFSGAGLLPAVIYLTPMVLFFPVFSAMTGQALSFAATWPWLVLNAILINGLVEESMMRGFVFRHFREHRSFWRAAVLATAYFAAYHIVLVFTESVLVGLIGVVIAVPTGLITAYAYEIGDNTVWGPALLHAMTNALIFIVQYSPDVQPVATSAYLVLGITAASAIVLWVYRSGFGREDELGSQLQPAI